MLSDIEISNQAKLRKITDIAAELGLQEDDLELYGPWIAKISAPIENKMTGKLVLVTAITPTPYGEGKTTVSIGLADALRKKGVNSVLALREPSMGPVFGLKGGACGGGLSQVLPMDKINLHFTGDLHAITSANNLLCAMVDNSIHQGNPLQIDPRRVSVRRCMDMNDRQLRHIVGGLGTPKDGMPREDGFDITAASEVMSVFCLAESLEDLKLRLGRIVVGTTYDGRDVTCAEIGAAGAMTALLKDAFMPNLVQTLYGTPCLIHGGPFANIAHGCNSIVATRTAMQLSDIAITEAGFGADLGAEKFIDIASRAGDFEPDCVVLVATVRALIWHGLSTGETPDSITAERRMEALQAGLSNLRQHIANVSDTWHLPVVVAVNRFTSDLECELQAVIHDCESQDITVALTEAWGKGPDGALDLAERVQNALANESSGDFERTYTLEMPLAEKLRTVCQRIYHADDISINDLTLKKLAGWEKAGYGKLPVCIAKTQYSFSDNAALRGAPKGFTVQIRDVRLSAGAGFVVAFAGDIIAMPGLPKKPAALQVDVQPDGTIDGLF